MKQGSKESKMEQERVSSEEVREDKIFLRWDHFELKLKENAEHRVYSKILLQILVSNLFS